MAVRKDDGAVMAEGDAEADLGYDWKRSPLAEVWQCQREGSGLVSPFRLGFDPLEVQNGMKIYFLFICAYRDFSK